MKVLLISSTGTPYVPQLWNYLKKYHKNIQYSLLTIDVQMNYYEKNLSLQEGEKIFTYHYDRLYKGLRKTIQTLPEFDIVHFLWMEWFYGLFVSELRKKTKKIYISVGGSDLYRDSKRFHVRMFQKRLIKYADYFSSENAQTRDYFYDVYGRNCSKSPHHIVNFGVDILDAMEGIYEKTELREKWGIPTDKYVIALGHNGRREHQHLAMIDAIEKMDRDLREKCFFLIPMTYLVPEESYVDEIKVRLDSFGAKYLLLRNYMNVTEMAETVAVCDAMVHVQTTDQLSSTMIAHMYAGNVVIVGSWLPYESLRKANIKFYSIDEISKLTPMISDVLCKQELYVRECKSNKERVYHFSSWEYAAKKWYGIYERLTEEI